MMGREGNCRENGRETQNFGAAQSVRKSMGRKTMYKEEKKRLQFSEVSQQDLYIVTYLWPRSRRIALGGGDSGQEKFTISLMH